MSDFKNMEAQERIITSREKENRNLFTPFNKVLISGEIESEFEFSHSAFHENFYKCILKIKRLNPNSVDFVTIVVPGDKVPQSHVKGQFAEVAGFIYSCKEFLNGNEKKLHVYARKISFYSNKEEHKEDENAIYLQGNVCKTPIYRKTPKGLIIAEVMISVKRKDKFHFIPCIAWLKEAEYVRTLKVGDEIKFYGRIQSRIYLKNLNSDEGRVEAREINEITIRKIII